MANIKPFLDAIKNAVYGREVRDSIISAISKVNDDNDSYQELKKEVLEANDSIKETVNKFDSDSGEFMKKAELAIEAAKNAKESETNARSYSQSAYSAASAAATSAGSAGVSANKAAQDAKIVTDNIEKAVGSATNAKQSEQNALQYKNDALSSKEEAVTAKNAAISANTDAQKAKTDTENAAKKAIDDIESKIEEQLQRIPEVLQLSKDVGGLKSHLSDLEEGKDGTITGQLSESITDLKEDLSALNADMDNTISRYDGFNIFCKTERIKDKVYGIETGVLTNKEGVSTFIIPYDSERGKRVRASYSPERIAQLDENLNAIKAYGNDYAQKGTYAIIPETSCKYVAFSFMDADVDYNNLMIAYTNESSGSASDKWSDLFGELGYIENIGSIVPLIAYDSVDHFDKTFFNVMSAYYKYENGDSVEFNGVSGTTFFYNEFFKCNPLDVFTVELYAKTSVVGYGGAGVGSGLDIRFYDNNGKLIGNKYTMECTNAEYGSNIYNTIAPLGSKTMNIRVFTRGSTRFNIKNIKIIKGLNSVNRNNSGIIYDSHLGYLLGAPENTIPAFEMSKRLGFSSIIINVKKTLDGELVVIHDSTIDATSNGSGSVSSYTLEQLKRFDFGSWFSKYYKDTRIPTVEEAIRKMSSWSIQTVFSLHGDMTSLDVEKLFYILNKYNMLNGTLFKTQSENELILLHSKFGDACKYALIMNSESAYTQGKEIINRNAFINYVEVFDYDKILSDGFVDQFRNLGVEFIGSITSNAYHIFQAIKKGVTRFTVDTGDINF